ncbi:MAG TPA: large conductance mechanosensitive channel protein MscL [Chloroflexia bacterium]|jgi:large conductance mechanosensitive channel
MFNEFKKFINRGNVIELAVAFVIGTAFAAVVKSLVDNIIMPPIGALLGGLDFTSLYINLSSTTYPTYAAAREAGAPVIGYGTFINAVITFLIVSFVVFLLVRAYNKGVKQPAPEVDTKDCPYCMTAIAIKATRCPACTSELAAAMA